MAAFLSKPAPVALTLQKKGASKRFALISGHALMLVYILALLKMVVINYKI